MPLAAGAAQIAELSEPPSSLIPRLWYAAAVPACLLGMASKEVMVTAPLMVLLYDRTFLTGSFADALRQRWTLYLGLAATWGLLGYLVFSAGPSGRPSGLPPPDAWSYARTQPGVIVHYLRLSAWPDVLCFQYEWPVASTLGEILPGTMLVAVLLAATAWGLLRRKCWGLPGAWFWLILAPTSSVLPLRQLAVEHRMYLPLAALAVLAVAGGYGLWDKCVCRPAASGLAMVWRWVAPVILSLAVLLALGSATASRNADYRSAVAIWQDTVNKRPRSAIAHYNLGTVLDGIGRTEDAILQYQQALQVKPDYAEAINNLGRDLAGFGRVEEAMEHFRQALRLRPDYTEAHNNLGNTLAQMGNTAAAIAEYAQALRLEPNYAEGYHNLGTVLASAGNTAEAIGQFQQALRVKPNYAEARHSLGRALAASGRRAEAIQQYYEAVRLKPDYTDVHNSLGSALFGAGRISEAIEQYAEAVRLKPYSASVHHNLGVALATVGKTAEAIEHYQQALQLKPNYAEAHSNFGAILADSGHAGEAIQHYQEALRLKPNYAEAHNNLANALSDLGRTSEAIEHYEQALQIKPDYLMAHVNLAWLLATRDSAQGGDPDRAVPLAQRACELIGERDARCLDALAAAYAAAGRFPEAVATAEKARQLGESSGQTALAASIQARLELYRAGRPYREAPVPAE